MNYELICAQRGLSIVSALTGRVSKSGIANMMSKSIGILQNSGVYAYLIWLDARTSSDDQACAKTLKEEVFDLISIFSDKDIQDIDAVKCLIEEISLEIEEVFLLKGLIQKMLTYALYRAKGIVEPSDGGKK